MSSWLGYRRLKIDPLITPDLPIKPEESDCYRAPIEDHRWREIIEQISSRLTKIDLKLPKRIANLIASCIEWLDIPMERYSEITCTKCINPCCKAQEIYYNLADILYLVAYGKAIPLGQTRTRKCDPCRYLGDTGCTLDRRFRPYICTWFMCEAQMELWRTEPPPFQREFLRVLQTIRILRLQLESLYEAKTGSN